MSVLPLRQKAVVAATICSALGTLALGFLPSTASAEWAFEHNTYPILCAALLVLLWLLVSLARARARRERVTEPSGGGERRTARSRFVASWVWLRPFALDVMLAAAFWIVVRLATSRQFRVLSDETNLL